MAPPPVQRLSDLCSDSAEAQLCAHSVGRTPGLGQGPSCLLPVLPRGGLRWVYLSGQVCKYLCVHLGVEGLGWSPPISSAHSSSSRAFLSLRCGRGPSSTVVRTASFCLRSARPALLLLLPNSGDRDPSYLKRSFSSAPSPPSPSEKWKDTETVNGEC